MDEREHIRLLQAIVVQAGIPAPVVYPADLKGKKMLPVAITLPAQAFYERKTATDYLMRRTYEINVYLEPVGREWYVDRAAQMALDLMPTLRTLLMTTPLRPQPGYPRFDPTGVMDSGLIVLPYSVDTFHGFVVRVAVLDYYSISIPPSYS